jgi:transcriptional regulator with XRE-family HTH domain
MAQLHAATWSAETNTGTPMPESKPLDRRRARRIIDFDIEIGHRIRVQRMLRSATQTELANAIGITFQQIQKYENGSNRVSAGKLYQIARFLGVAVTVFFEGLETGTSAGSGAANSPAYQQLLAFVTSAEGERLYRAFAQIRKKETQRTLLRMVESLSSSEEKI